MNRAEIAPGAGFLMGSQASVAISYDARAFEVLCVATYVEPVRDRPSRPPGAAFFSTYVDGVFTTAKTSEVIS